ncbi:MAG TPA: ABC transporter ATP-binding protein, partial [Actinomycetota bacterium]|nr:ABC transporter ATP-binding protein [Actinomycetota bacterium]
MFPTHGGPWSLMRSRSDLRGHRLPNGLIRRALGYAAHYKAKVAAFLVATVAGSFLAVIPPLLFRALLDRVLPAKDQDGLAVLAVAAVGVAIGTALLSLAARWFSANVG